MGSFVFRGSRLSGVVLGVALGLAPPTLQARAEPGRLVLTTGMDYSSGTYGTSNTTEMLYVPFTAKYEFGRSTLKATLPYLRVTGPSGSTLVDADGHVISSGSGPKKTEQGLGDMVLSYGYSLFEKPLNGFLVDLVGKAKLATADRKNGLGTGKNDFAAQADVYYLAGRHTPFFTLGYRVYGDPSGVDLNNIAYATLGDSYKLSDQDHVGAMWEVRQATRPGRQGMNDLTLFWMHKLDRDMKLQAYAIAGLSDASPDREFGLMFSFAP